MRWPPEREARLRHLYLVKRYGSRLIATILSREGFKVTRNAVSGKMARLRLPARGGGLLGDRRRGQLKPVPDDRTMEERLAPRRYGR